MRKTTSLLVSLSAVAIAGCGSSGTFANKASPPQPINVTVYINNSKVSASPASIGSGPVNFIVTNQASSSESLTILPAGSSAGQPLADTGPINPQATAQVTVNFSSKGDYSDRHQRRRRQRRRGGVRELDPPGHDPHRQAPRRREQPAAESVGTRRGLSRAART